MLLYEHEWRTLGAHALAERMLGRASVLGLYHSVATLLTRACMEQCIADRGIDGAVRSTRYGLVLRSSVYHVLPCVDDHLPGTLRKLQRLRLDVTLISPPWSAKATDLIVGPLRNAAVLGLDTYLNLRTAFTALDRRVSSFEATRLTLRRYNGLARASLMKSCFVGIPPMERKRFKTRGAKPADVRA